MDFPGRIPFLHHLWGCIRIGCLRIYLKIPVEEWEIVDIDDEWGLYDIDSKNWIQI